MQSDDDERAPQDNLKRLRSRLKKDSFAEKLVSARIAAGAAYPRPALRNVVEVRIEELGRGYESLPNRKT